MQGSRRWWRRRGDAGTDTRQQALAIQILSELAELSPAELAAALAYVRQSRLPPVTTPRHSARLSFEASTGEEVGVAPAPDRVASRVYRFLDRPLLRATPPDQADVVVRALGPLKVEVGGRRVQSWSGSRVRTIFEYLLLHHAPVHRDVLMELLWPGYPRSSARNNLNVSMYGLRRALDLDGDRDYVVHREGRYVLNPDLAWSVDFARFTQAVQESQVADASGRPAAALVHAQLAIQEYRGDLFEDDSSADWCDNERATLADMFAQTLELQAELFLDRGDVDAAQRAAQRLIDQDGCRESAHRLLMTCHARRNQRDQIVRQYRRCVTKLHDELDVAPSTETVRLFRQLTESR